MITEESFLTRREKTDFNMPGRRRDRRLIERYPGTGAKSVRLVEELVSTVRLHRNDTVEDGYWFEAACVQLRQGDGMTWSAEAVRQGLDKAYPNFRIRALSDESTPDGLPAIGAVAGDDFLLHSAVRAKLTRAFVSLDSRHGLINFALVVAVAALTQIFMMLLKSSGDTEGPFFSPSLYLALGGYSLLAAITQWVLATRFFKRDDAIARLVTNLQDENRTLQIDDLADRVAQQLAREAAPRFVIVDGFGRLDDFSQRVIEAYFDRHTTRHTASEMWVIFETDDDVVFGAMVPRRNGYGGYSSTRLYDQELLSAQERTQLAETVKVPERAAFATVKQICSFTGGDVEWIDTWFREYVKRTGEPKRNALTYFYLLALEQPDLLASQRQHALGGHLFFPWPWLERLSAGEASDATIQIQSLAAQKQTELAKIVAQFFGSPLRVDEIANYSTEIQRDFGRFIVYKDERTKERFHVSREAAEWLVDHERELELPSASVGKLFWALALSNAKPNDSSWTRRAIRNLLEVDLGQIPDEVRAELYPKVRELFVKVIESSVRRSRFHDVPELLEAAVNAVIDFDPEKTVPLTALKEKAWEVYLISGSDAALRALLTTGDYLGETVKDVDGGRLLHLFAQTCRLTPASRALLEAQLTSASGSTLPVAHDHAEAVAIWALVTGAPFLYTRSYAKGAHSLFDLTDLLGTLEETIDRVTARVAESAGTYVLDIATLSMTAWSLALLLHDDLPWLRKPGEELLPIEQIKQARLGEVVVAAEKVAIAAGLYVKTSRKPGTANFLGEAMTYDACAAALAAAWFARAVLRRWSHEVVIPIDAGQQRVIDSVNEILQTNIVASAEDGDKSAIAHAERLLHASAMTWQRFGLERLTHIASIRRIAFSFRSRGIVAADYGAHKPLVESVSGILREPDVTGLLANLTLAHCFSGSAGMLSYYVTLAAELAHESDFGNELRTALALIAVLHPTEKMAERAEKLAAQLLTDSGDGAVLQGYVNSVPDDDVKIPIAWLNGFRSYVTVPEVARGLEEVIRRRAQLAQSDAIRAELLDLLALTDLEREEAAGKLDPNEIMKEWASRRDRWTYPAVLTILLDVPSGPALVRPEAERVLTRDASLDENNAWYRLAIRLTKNLVANNLSADVPVRYMRNAVSRWEHLDREETNLDTYRLLARLDIAKRTQHRERLTHWQSIIIERDHLQLLPELALRGRFFLIFTDYVEHMWHWGLGINVPDAEVFRRKNLVLNVREATAAEWKKDGADVSHALIATQDGTVAVNGDFLLTGELLFTPPVENDSDYDQDRLRFDDEARRSLPTLIDEIRRLETVPLSIRNLIARYAKDCLNIAPAS